MTGVRYFGKSEQMEEFIFQMRTYGLTAALEEEGWKRDPLLRYGPDLQSHFSEYRTEPGVPYPKHKTRALRLVVIPDSSKEL